MSPEMALTTSGEKRRMRTERKPISCMDSGERWVVPLIVTLRRTKVATVYRFFSV